MRCRGRELLRSMQPRYQRTLRSCGNQQADVGRAPVSGLTGRVGAPNVAGLTLLCRDADDMFGALPSQYVRALQFDLPACCLLCLLYIVAASNASLRPTRAPRIINRTADAAPQPTRSLPLPCFSIMAGILYFLAVPPDYRGRLPSYAFHHGPRSQRVRLPLRQHPQWSQVPLAPGPAHRTPPGLWRASR